MTVYELNRDQLQELKVRYYQGAGEDLSYDEIVNIDNLVSDREVYSYYRNFSFSPDDFASSAGEEFFVLEIGDCTGSRYEIADNLRQIANLIEDGAFSGLSNYGTSWSIE
jgi:hypothetical protein